MRTIIGMILVSLCLTGCSSNSKQSSGGGTLTQMPTDIADIQQLNQSEIKTDTAVGDDKHLRTDMLRDTALSIGARSGLSHRATEINAMLAERTTHLNQIFNFQSLVLADNVMPPVLVESRDALNLETPHTIRTADRQYRIVKQARFVTGVPLWQDYLLFKVSPPELPDASLLPGDEDEQVVWSEYTAKGWKNGLEQANQIYAENLSRLKRDYQGMIRYRVLLAQNMVSAPELAQRDMGITGGGEEMAVNDRILTIKALPALKADTSQWQASVN